MSASDRTSLRLSGGKNPKRIKYESPVGIPNQAYFPQGVWQSLGDPTSPLILTEGEKKALAGTQAGYSCVRLVGVFGWQLARKRNKYGHASGPRYLIPDLAAIPWQGRLVFVIFDSDAATKPQVQAAERHLVAALTAAGAIVRIVRLPAAHDLEK